MPTYTIPNFNVVANIWRAGGGPPGPPDVTTDAQLYTFSRASVDVTEADPGTYQPAVYLRVPRGTDLRQTDIAEVVAGSGYTYTVRWVERVHLGFPNEYLEGLLQQDNVPDPLITQAANGLAIGNGMPTTTILLALPPLPLGRFVAFLTVNNNDFTAPVCDVDGNPLTVILTGSPGAGASFVTYALHGDIPANPGVPVFNATIPTNATNWLLVYTVLQGLANPGIGAAGGSAGVASTPSFAAGATAIGRTFAQGFILLEPTTGAIITADAPFTDQAAQLPGGLDGRGSFCNMSVIANPTLTDTALVGVDWLALVIYFQ